MRKHILIVVVSILAATPAYAAKAASHCLDKNKQEITLTVAPGKSSAAACKAAGGTWVKVKTTTKKTTTKTTTK